MIFLVISILLPLISPFFDYVFSFTNSSKSFFSGFIVTLAPIVIVNLLFSDLLTSSGWISSLVLAIGFFFPLIIDKVKSFHNAEEADLYNFIISFIFIGLHDFLEGSIIYYSVALQDLINTKGLQLAIVLHRLPLALFLYYYLKPKIGYFKSYLALVFLSMATVTGYFITYYNKMLIRDDISGYFILFAIGSLIHIVKHELEKLKNKVYSHKWVGVGIFTSVLTSFLFWI